MIVKLLQPEIRDLIAVGDIETLRDILEDWLPADVATLMADLNPEERLAIFSALDADMEASIFEYLDLVEQEELLEELPEAKIAEILNVMSPDDRTELLEQLPEEESERLLTLLTKEQRAVAETLLSYADYSVGRLMTPDYLAVRRDWTVRHVLDFVRVHGRDSETLSVIYVVDGENRLIGDLRIHELLLAPLYKNVGEVMDSLFISLRVDDDQETVVGVFRKYDRTVLPVIDPNGMLLGIVTIDDVLDVAEEEATEDIQKFGGMEALELPYMDIPIFAMIRKRATWLAVLFIGEMLTTSAMAYFEGEIAKAVVLAMFIPLIMSSGGNSGSQAATLTIRALALNEVTLRDWWRVMRREIVAGLAFGTMLGVLGFARIALWTLFSDQYGEHWMLIGFTVCLAVIGVVMLGTLAGSMLPFILKRFGADPATSSAPFIATLVDVTALVIYFAMASLVLSGVLL